MKNKFIFGALVASSLISQSTAALVWTQLGGTSNSSGVGSAHVNTFLDSPVGSNGAVNLISTGATLSYGSLSDGMSTVDYVVSFGGGDNPLKAEPVNNSFTIHPDGSADFFSASESSFGRAATGPTPGDGVGTFADNGNAGIRLDFYQSGTYDPMTGSGIPVFAEVGLAAVNTQPSIYGGSDIFFLNTDEFFDIDSGPNAIGSWVEVDPSNQVVVYDTLTAVGLTADGTTNTLVNYYGPVGGTATDAGTGGFVDPLTGDFRIEFNFTHQVAEAEWLVRTPSTTGFTLTRPGDAGQRSGIGFTGTLGTVTAIPEPSSTLATCLLLSVSFLLRSRR